MDVDGTYLNNNNKKELGYIQSTLRCYASEVNLKTKLYQKRKKWTHWGLNPGPHTVGNHIHFRPDKVRAKIPIGIFD
jgi:hypothetical protein